MNDRNMFYQNYNASSFNVPNGMPMQQMQYQNQMMPSGYNVSSQVEAFGPNVVPSNMNNLSAYNGYNEYENNFEQRITKLEKQVKILDNRVQKLESQVTEEETQNIYMI